jgi:hypothetical protein
VKIFNDSANASAEKVTMYLVFSRILLSWEKETKTEYRLNCDPPVPLENLDKDNTDNTTLITFTRPIPPQKPITCSFLPPVPATISVADDQGKGIELQTGIPVAIWADPIPAGYPGWETLLKK